MTTTEAASPTITRSRLNPPGSADEPATSLTIGGQTPEVTGSPCALLATSLPLDELRFRVSRVAP